MALKGFGFVFFQSDSEGVSQTSSREQDKEGDGKLGPRWVGMCVKRASTLSLPGLQGILCPWSHSPLASSPAHGPCVSSPGALLSSPRLRLGFRASFFPNLCFASGLPGVASHPNPQNPAPSCRATWDSSPHRVFCLSTPAKLKVTGCAPPNNLASQAEGASRSTG